MKKIKNEAELLNKFCDVVHVKPLLRTPFLNTEYNEVWSTDGRVFIGNTLTITETPTND